MKAFRFCLVLLLGAGLGACVTATEVRSIVAESNLALLPQPSLTPDGKSTATDPREAVERIERFIQDHPDQELTNNALRLRQALIFAVHKDEHLAKQSFKMIENKKFPTDRDRALLSAGPDLAWWYRHSEDAQLTPDDKAYGLIAGPQLGKSCALVPQGSDTRIFLATFRGLLTARIVNVTLVGDVNREELRRNLVEAARGLYEALSEEDRTWVVANWAAMLPESAPLPLVQLRARMDARAALRLLKSLSGPPKNLSVEWDPKWVKDLPQ